jgi:ArsR family transcriptional regulator, arsenate/arsenite/antimonite-responsive transcriptional repressor
MPSRKTCCAALERWLSPGLFKALGDPNRLAILVALADGGRERTVSELADCCPVDLSGVSRHLRTLREAGVLEARREGKEVLYRVRFDAVVAILRNLADALEGCCPPTRAPVLTSGREPTDAPPSAPPRRRAAIRRTGDGEPPRRTSARR